MVEKNAPSRLFVGRGVSKGGAVFLFAAALGLVAAHAQPTGNPKGTATPSETTAPKPSASGRAGAGVSEGGKLVGNAAQNRARIQGAKPPGGGTEGGLTRRDAAAPTASDAARSDKGSATARPLPPSK